MSTILQEAAAGRATILPWTVAQYHQALTTGLLAEDTACELLDGFIVFKDRAAAGENPMTIGDRHRVSVLRLATTAGLFERCGCFLQTQQPISLPPHSEPEPDGAVVQGRIDDYLEGPPVAADVSCVIEVADSSLSLDLGPKLRTYASAGIPQYVVIDLVNDRLLIHEEPSGESFLRVTALTSGQTAHIFAGSERGPLAVERVMR